MVSQPDHHHPSHSLTVRGPSSVVSAPRSSSRTQVSSRSKRYNRSHAGGTSCIPQNEFPVFNHSGDVEILISAGGRTNRYLLHRHTLTRCSGFFEASTSLEWSKSTPMPALPELPSREVRFGADSAVSVGSTRSGNGSAVARGDEFPRPIAPGAGSSMVRRKWRYELDPGAGRDDIPMLIQKEEDSSIGSSAHHSNSIFGNGDSYTNPTSRHKHSHSSTAGSFFRSVANLSISGSSHHATNKPSDEPLSPGDAELLRNYDNLFRIFYNYPPVLDGINIADAYVQCKSLLQLADQYDALAVIGPRVDHHLLQFQSRLWKQIAKYPVSYLRLGYLARSKVIFQEALIHVVGQWPAGERSIRSTMPPIVIDIIEDKVDELEENIGRIEGRLFRLNLTTSRGERVTPATSYLDWLAISFFRQWLADHTSPAPTPPPPPPPPPDRRSSRAVVRSTPAAVATAAPSLATIGRTYRTLGSGNMAAFLGHDECKRFLKLTPDQYSRDNLRRFEKRIDELKNAARELVHPLMGSGLELELNGTPSGSGSGGGGGGGGSSSKGVTTAVSSLGYLTCVKIFERDLPWAAEG